MKPAAPGPLFVCLPETRSGRGTGHLRRAMALARADGNSYIHLPAADISTCRQAFPQLDELKCGNDLPAGIFIYDKHFCSHPELVDLARQGTLVVVDGRGPALDRAAVLVDMLPRLDRTRPNIADRSFLVLPQRRRAPVEPAAAAVRSVLISFGGEDWRKQARRLKEAGTVERLFPQARITVVQASRMASGVDWGDWQVLHAPPVLRESLADYDVVITLFGLTAWEASAAGCLVLLWNPTPYHEALARKDGFVTLGARRRPHWLGSIDSLLERSRERALLAPAEHRDLAATIRSWNLPAVWTCPACRQAAMRALERFDGRTFGCCSSCGMVSMLLLGPARIHYDSAYFFEEYQAQYGKTYLEDFDHIKAMGQRRLRQIGRIKSGKGRLLDLGAAYGPFLDAARDAGYQAEGVDISADAVEHCRSLGFRARVLDLANTDAATLCDQGPYDVVSMWYVIEHFSDLAHILELLSAAVKPGGVLALATPSYGGISRRKNRRHFLERSPWDHHTVWDPATIGPLLARHGFRLVRIVGSGHHPERFPGLLGMRAFRPLSLLLSRFLGLADTFELYAQRLGGTKA